MNIQEEIIPILREIEILSPTAFRFRDEMMPATAGFTPMPSVPGFPSHPLPEIPLVRDIQSVLYARCYSRRMEEAPPPDPQTLVADPTFLPKLMQSNRSRPGWEGGWTVYQVSPNGQVWLSKGDRQRSAVPGEFISTGPPGVAPQSGSIVNVQVARESTVAQPGFYFMYGETLGDVWDDQSVVRFYFHAPSSAAPELIEALTPLLNRYQVPFRMKALNEPAMYGRTDAVVLYVARRYHDITVRIVRQLPVNVADRLHDSTPLFARPLQPGVGVAEDPNTGESFGMHRCRLMAEGIFDAWQRNDQSVDGRLRAVAARFTQNGLKLEFPHLSADSVDLADVLKEVEFAYA
jgi:hypothetical protein